jgi:hypothetical protein
MTKQSIFRINSSALVALLFITAVLFCTGATQAATVDVSTASKLEAISVQMAKEHRSDFILVQALKDGLIEDGKAYDFLWTSDLIIVNGKQLTGEVAARYAKLMGDFFAKEPANKQTSVLSMRGDGLKLEEVLNANSTYRKLDTGPRAKAPAGAHNAPEESKNYLVKHAYYPNTIIDEMVADGLTDTSRRVHISYTKKGLFVDELPLSGAMDAKYRARFKELSSFDPSKDNVSIDIVSTPDAPDGKAASKNQTEAHAPSAKGNQQNIRTIGASDLANVRVYPNPATDYITVEGATGGSATITNAIGQQISALSFNITEASQRIDIHTLPTGNYVVKIETAKGSTSAINISKQ